MPRLGGVACFFSQHDLVRLALALARSRATRVTSPQHFAAHGWHTGNGMQRSSAILHCIACIQRCQVSEEAAVLLGHQAIHFAWTATQENDWLPSWILGNGL